MATLLTTRIIILKIRRKVLNLPPGPVGLFPIINSLPLFLSSGGFVNFNTKIINSYGPIVNYSVFQGAMNLINDGPLAKQTYKTLKDIQFTKGEYSANNKERDYFGKNFKTVRNFKRVLASSELNAKSVEIGCLDALKKFIYPVFDDEKVATHGIDVASIFHPLVFDLLYFAVTGFHIDSTDDPFFVEFVKTADQVANQIFEQIINCMTMGRTEIPHTDQNPFKPLVDVTEKYLIKNQNEILTKNKDSLYAKLYNDYKDDESELIFDCAIVLSAALDALSIELQQVIYHLTKYPKEQQMIYDELCQVFKENDMEIKDMRSNLSKLHNLNAFVFEVLRWFPPTIGSNIRKIVEPNGRMINGYRLPKGASVGANIYAINRDKKYWKYGDEFNINNFKNDKNEFYYEKGKKQSFATFGFGPRMCPGMSLGVKILQNVIASLILRYEISAPKQFKDKPLGVKYDAFMLPDPTFPVLFKLRQ